MVQSLLLTAATLLSSLELHRIDAFAPSSLNPSTRCVASAIISRHQNHELVRRDNFAILSSHNDSSSGESPTSRNYTTASRRSILQSKAVSLITISSSPQSTPASISLNPFKSSGRPQSFTQRRRNTNYRIFPRRREYASRASHWPIEIPKIRHHLLLIRQQLILRSN
eukprot:scaffold17853_cov65-Cyclotella_meneghiniana.AAC.1